MKFAITKGSSILELLLASIVEGSDDAIISKDLTGIITSWNKGAERIFGYTAEEAVGRPITMIAAPERLNEMPSILERVKRGERVDHYETIRQTKTGRRVHISLTVSPIYDEAGRIIGASKIARDISDRVAAEQALAKQAERLARANADLQQFAYITSHDLKEPLRTVVACTELFLSKSGEKLDAEDRQILGYVISAAKRMTDMISDLLPYARTLSEELPAESLKISQVVDWAVNNLHLAIESSGAEISYQPESLPSVRGNKLALVQLFQNLLGNAIKYCSSEPPRIAIWAERRENGWCFFVRDNGIGIAPAYHKRIFTLFQRLQPQQCPGTGVGLALCRTIVQGHGGEIWVESEEGKGATFIFTLPDEAKL
jgi:PAS domain S-box-containing protein